MVGIPFLESQPYLLRLMLGFMREGYGRISERSARRPVDHRPSGRNVGEIDWFGAAGNYVELHVGSSSYLLRRTMKDMEGFLDPSRFLRIHRATIVNSRRIEGFRVRAWGNYEVVLHDGVRLKETRGIPEKRSEFAVICHIPQSVLPLNRPIMKCTPIHLCAIVRRCHYVIRRQSVGSGC